MSRDDFLDAAIEAGVVARDGCGYFVCSDDVDEILSLAALVAAREREACAALCAEWGSICDSGRRHGAKVGAQECVTLIRKRSTS